MTIASHAPGEDRVQGMTSLFNLPGHIVPVALVSLGFPAESKEFDDRFTEKKIHRDRW